MDGVRGVRVAAGVDQNAVEAVVAGGPDPADQITFVIALAAFDAEALRFGDIGQAVVNLRQRRMAVNVRFACTQPIEIGAAQHQNLLRLVFSGRAATRSAARAQASSSCAKVGAITRKR